MALWPPSLNFRFEAANFRPLKIKGSEIKGANWRILQWNVCQFQRWRELLQGVKIIGRSLWVNFLNILGLLLQVLFTSLLRNRRRSQRTDRLGQPRRTGHPRPLSGRSDPVTIGLSTRSTERYRIPKTVGGKRQFSMHAEQSICRCRAKARNEEIARHRF